MPNVIAVLEEIKSFEKAELKRLANELFYLEEQGVYLENSEVKRLARKITQQLDGIPLNHAQELVNRQVLRVIARHYVSEE